MLNETIFIQTLQNKSSFEIFSYITQNTLLPSLLILAAVPWFILFICGMIMTNNKVKFIKIMILPTIILIILLLLIIYPIIPEWTAELVSKLLG